jgi:hypothetical protein
MTAMSMVPAVTTIMPSIVLVVVAPVVLDVVTVLPFTTICGLRTKSRSAK